MRKNILRHRKRRRQNVYQRYEIKNLLEGEDAAVTAEFMAMYKKDFKKMKVVTQGDSQVCYYGSMKKEGRGQRETSSFVFCGFVK